jgi:hypothetical protein
MKNKLVGKNLVFFSIHMQSNVARRNWNHKILFPLQPRQSSRGCGSSASGTEQPLTELSKQNQFKPLEVRKNKEKQSKTRGGGERNLKKVTEMDKLQTVIYTGNGSKMKITKCYK